MKKSIGFIIALVILALALLFILYKYNKTNKENKATISQLKIEKQQVEGELEQLSISYDTLQTENKDLQKNLEIEKTKVEGLVLELKKTRQNCNSQINRYYGEVTTLKDQLQTYISQIDSLKNVNRQLASENSMMREQVISAENQIAALKEEQGYMSERLAEAGKLEAMNVSVQTYKKKGGKTKKAKKTAKVEVNFVLSRNDVAESGEVDIYVVITKPNGTIIGNPQGEMFQSEGGNKLFTVKRQVLYGGDYLPVAVFYDTKTTLVPGRYGVELFANDKSIGKSFFALK